MQFGHGGMGSGAIQRGPRSQRSEVPRSKCTMALVAVVGLTSIIAVTVPETSTASAASPPVARGKMLPARTREFR